jgi:glycosyltransferase involved in cell wall biosynthesis
VWTGLAFAKFKALVQLGRPFTSRLLCCSHYIQLAAIRDFGLTPQETRAIYNACDLRRFIPGIRVKSPHQFYRLCMVGRLEHHKDQPTLIRAVAHLRTLGIDTELWLIGDGTCRNILEVLIDELQLSDRVQLLGSRRDIPELLNQVDLFVFSARRDEGFGIALAEAMATSVPIVASDVGACREVLDEGRCGFLVKPNSADALALGILEVLHDPESARLRAIAAREYALANFNISAMADSYGQELGLG